MLSRMKRLLRSRAGAESVEAAISLPIIILTAMLLLRLFTFYLEILDTGVREHEKALEAWENYKGAGGKAGEKTVDVKMLRGGLLRMDLTKKIRIRTYCINEDLMVRAGEFID
ncbi:MAG: hypothetical protein E7220_00560 [Clostridiales bacterium]|nr:hypothetical protein [Clostridiales bacterium]